MRHPAPVALCLSLAFVVTNTHHHLTPTHHTPTILNSYISLSILWEKGGNKPLKDFSTFKWKPSNPITRKQLVEMKEAFWDTQPAYSGRMEIWQALKLACEAESTEFAQTILDSTGVTTPTGNLADGCYDELGNQYIIPLYCFVDPLEIAADPPAKGNGSVIMAANSFDEPRTAGSNTGAASAAGAAVASSSANVIASHSPSPPRIASTTTTRPTTVATTATAASTQSPPTSRPPSPLDVTSTNQNLLESSSKTCSPSITKYVSQGANYSNTILKSSSDTDLISQIAGSTPQPETPDTIPITLRLSTGIDLKHNLLPGDTIAQVKSAIRHTKEYAAIATHATKHSAHKPHLKVILLGKVLNNDVVLASANVHKNTIVQVFVQIV